MAASSPRMSDPKESVNKMGIISSHSFHDVISVAYYPFFGILPVTQTSLDTMWEGIIQEHKPREVRISERHLGSCLPCSEFLSC